MRALQPLQPRRRPACSVAYCCAGVIRVMHELMAAEAGAGPIMTQLFFLTFTLSCVFLVINLFVSVVVVAVQKNEEEAWANKQAGKDGDQGKRPPRRC